MAQNKFLQRVSLEVARAAIVDLTRQTKNEQVEPEGALGRVTGEPVFARFRWGEAEVVASGSWRLRVEPSRTEGHDHLSRFLRLADETYPELRLRDREEAWLLFAGWGSRFYRPLRRLERRDPGPPFTRDFSEAEGFGATRLRVDSYLDALAAASTSRGG